MSYEYDILFIKIGPVVWAGHSLKNTAIIQPNNPKDVISDVFSQTTHIVALPHGFACVVIPATSVFH